MTPRLAAALLTLAALAWAAAAGAQQSTAPGPVQRPAVILVGGGVGGQAIMAPLATACAVGGFPAVCLAPASERGGLAGLAARLDQAARELSRRPEVSEVALVAHGAGGLAAAAFLAGRPPGVRRAMFLALPTRGLVLPPGGDPCRDAWRDRVARFYGPEPLAQAAPGGALARSLAAKGLPPEIMAASVAGFLDPAAAEAMVPRTGCAAGLAGLAGDGVVARASLAELPGHSREDRSFRVAADHLALPGARRTRDLMLRFLRLPHRDGRVAVVLVIDASGSVRSTDRLGLRDEAVRLLVSRLAAGDRVGVVAFDTRAREALGLTAIKDAEQAARVAREVPALPSRGDTDIGAGLALAGRMLAKAPIGARRVVVLLTDGRNDPESANGSTLDAARLLAGQGARLYAVGLTDRVDELFLSRLAKLTEGEYLFAADAADLTAVFDRVRTALDGRSLLWAGRGELPAKAELVVDSSVERLEVSLFCRSDRAAAALVGPDGRPAEPARVGGRGYQVYSLVQPPEGVWRLDLTGPAGQPYLAQASAATGLTVRLAAWRDPPAAGKPWPFALDVTQDDLPLARCRARVQARGPGGRTAELELAPAPPRGFSAGLTNAGTLAGSLPAFAVAGDADLRAMVTGRNAWDEPFQRLLLTILHVSDRAEERALERTLEGRTLLRREAR